MLKEQLEDDWAIAGGIMAPSKSSMAEREFDDGRASFMFSGRKEKDPQILVTAQA